MFLDRSITFSFLIIFHGNSGFNLNPKSYQLIKDPNDNSFSFFGFKVAFQKRSTLAVPDNSNPWLLVGSPRSEIKFLRTSKEPGDVFKCDTGNPRIESCYSIFNDKLLKEIQFEQYSNAWIGAVVETHSYNKEHVILVCGPRYGPDHNPGKQYSVDGICFFLNGTSTSLIAEDPDPWAAPTESSFGWRGRRTLTGNRGSVRFSTQTTARLHPLRPPLPRVVTGSKSIYGLSADFEKVSEGWSALIGLISIHRAAEWEGFVSRVNYSPLKEKGERFKEERRFLRDNKLENKRIKNSYFGSTVIAGKSIDENLIYVSTPRNGSAGKVEVYQKQSNGNTQKPMRFYPGEQTGEVFGASICASDFNNDGFEDIIVGAPFFARSEESFNEGRISVIISNEYDNSFTTSYRYGQRKKSQAQFGLSLSVIGDLNKDGLPDIAVGAPYEDGRGAIYIFLGDKVNGISKRFSQHILASEVDHSLRGFGISMTGEQDVDFNHFDDIGVGSYLSSTVVLIKSKQVIKLRGELKILSGFEREVISVNDEPLLISACVIYEEGQFKTDTAYVQMKIDVDKKNKRTKSVQFNSSLATLNGSTIEAVSEISYNTTFCLNFTVQLQEEIKNRDDELLIEMQSYTLNDDERCELKECPMTDPKLYGVLTELRLRFETYFADLQLYSEFINVSGSTFMHTSAKKDLAIKVKLINKKDTAIATNLDIKMTSILSVKYVEGDERCKSFIQLETESGQTRYHCNFRNVKRNEERTIIMHLSTSDLTPEIDELIFNFTVSSSSKESEEDLENNDGSLALSVHVETPLFISGYPNPTEIIISKDEKSDIFKHVYDVCNKSPMKLAVGVKITVPIPVIISAAGRVPMFLLQGKLQLPNEEISCSNDADENLHKFFIEWSDLPDQNFTINVGKELKSKAEKIMKNNFDCNHQTQLFSEGSSIALACVNISCSSYLSEGNATIELRMRSSYRVFEYLIGTDGMRKFITEASVFLSHYREKFHLTGIREANVETKITVDIQENPIWPLVLAIVLTLILLIIITYGLYKANFFKRNRVNKDISNDAAAKSTDNLLTE